MFDEIPTTMEAAIDQWFSESWERLQEEVLATRQEGMICRVSMPFGAWLYDMGYLAETDDLPMALGVGFVFMADSDWTWELDQ